VALSQRLAVAVASLGGVGFIRPAPGTWGSLATALLAWPVGGSGWPGWLAAGVLITAAGFAATAVVLRAADAGAGSDPQWVVVDEAAGMWFALLFAPAEPLAWLLALLLFRVFDIGKPWLVGWADRRLPGALGVMADDVIAGLLVAPIVPICVVVFGWLA